MLGLAIDLGTSNTVAMLRSPDGRVRPLLFDGAELLPSAVYLDDAGTLLVGRDAQRMAGHDPTRYEPHPKRRVDEATVLLGDRDVPVTDLLAAVLTRVRQEAERVAGAPPPAVLTHPAGWGEPRRELLRLAARSAGLGEVLLVAEPVAAAAYFGTTVRADAPYGAPLAVFDFGAGTLDVAVVRLGVPDGVLATGGLDDLGGLDLDAAVVEHLAGTIDDPGTWKRLDRPAGTDDRRDRVQLWDEVRAAKEGLSRLTMSPVRVPGVAGGTHLTRDEFERLATPLVERAVAATEDVVRDAGVAPGDLVGLFLVGGSSRVPLVARLLAAGLGVPPVVLDRPETAVAEGALRLAPGAPVPGAPVPPSSPRRRGVWRPLVAAGLAVLLVVLVGCDLLLATRPGRAATSWPPAGQRAALSAARQAAPKLLGYDYRTFTRDATAGAAWCTGSYRATYTKTMRGLRDAARSQRAVVTSKVSDAGIAGTHGDDVEILVYVNQTRTNDTISGEKVDQSRVTLLMRRVAGRWRVAKLVAV